MQVKSKSGRMIPLPTPAEDARIRKGIAADETSPSWSKSDFAKAKPAKDMLPPGLYRKLVEEKRKAGRPHAEEHKVKTSIRLDADVLDRLRSSGKGWQTRVNTILRQYVEKMA